MYHLRLIKGKTYWGIVKASNEKPDVHVSEKEQADFLVASGFFEVVGNDEEGSPMGGQPNNGDGGAEKGAEEGADFIGADESDEEESGSVAVMVELQQKTKAELSEYAEQGGIDLTGCKTKDDIITKIIEELAKAAASRQAIRDGE